MGFDHYNDKQTTCYYTFFLYVILKNIIFNLNSLAIIVNKLHEILDLWTNVFQVCEIDLPIDAEMSNWKQAFYSGAAFPALARKLLYGKWWYLLVIFCKLKYCLKNLEQRLT